MGFVLTSPAGGESAKEMSSTRLLWRSLHQPLLPQQPRRMPEWCLPTLCQCLSANTSTHHLLGAGGPGAAGKVVLYQLRANAVSTSVN